MMLYDPIGPGLSGANSPAAAMRSRNPPVSPGREHPARRTNRSRRRKAAPTLQARPWPSRTARLSEHARAGNYLPRALPIAATNLHMLLLGNAALGRVRPLFRASKLREVALGDGLAETRLENFQVAGDLVRAPRLQVLAAQTPAHADGEVWAVAALLPRPQDEERRLRLVRPDTHLGDFHPRDARHRRALVDAPVGVDGVAVLPMQLAGPERLLERLVPLLARSQPADLDALVELHQRLRFAFAGAARAARLLLLGIDDGLEAAALQLPLQPRRIETLEQLLEARLLVG